jgi:hypothetical protein
VKFIKQRWILIYNKIIKSSFVQRIVNNRFVILFLRFRAFISSSLLAFSAFVLCNWAFLAVARLAYMWYFDRWDFINAYYYITGGSLAFILIVILLRYLATKSIFKRVLDNRVKHEEFEKIVVKTHSLHWTGWIKKYGWLLLLLAAIPTAVTGFPVPSILMLSIYLFSSAYVDYFAGKTEIPENLLREPPQFYFRLYEKFYAINSRQTRKYGSGALVSDATAAIKKAAFKVYNNPRPVFVAAKLVTSLVGAAISADATLASMGGTVPVVTQFYSSEKYNYYSSKPVVQGSADQLRDWGVNVTSLCLENSKELDAEKVSSVYIDEQTKRYRTTAQRKLEETLASLSVEVVSLREEVKHLKQLNSLAVEATGSVDTHLSERTKAALQELEIENATRRAEAAAERPAVDEKEGLPYMD